MAVEALPSSKDVLNRDRIVEDLSQSLERGRRYQEPYLHYQFRPFSDALYAKLLEHLPEDQAYIELRHADAIRPDGTSARLVFPFTRNMLAKLPAEQRDFWSEFNEAMSSDAVCDVFKARLEPELTKRFHMPLREIPAIPKLMLMRDMASYKINIHHDIEWKTITTQYYLPDDDSQRHLGTGIYARQPDGKFVQTHKMEFIPGNAYCFAVSKHSWHAVEPVGEIAKPRNSMMLIYFRDPGHDY